MSTESQDLTRMAERYAKAAASHYNAAIAEAEAHPDVRLRFAEVAALVSRACSSAAPLMGSLNPGYPNGYGPRPQEG